MKKCLIIISVLLLIAGCNVAMNKKQVFIEPANVTCLKVDSFITSDPGLSEYLKNSVNTELRKLDLYSDNCEFKINGTASGLSGGEPVSITAMIELLGKNNEPYVIWFYEYIVEISASDLARNIVKDLKKVTK